ncbi:MAG TPA: polymer-forming cytoskeletal protein [Thermomicrobiales bacterium]|nr:polymer-forming cytoskeletal protein [Thermomicrobiales bacterium]
MAASRVAAPGREASGVGGVRQRIGAFVARLWRCAASAAVVLSRHGKEGPMFRREKNSKLDNEGLRRMREAIRQRLDQEEAASDATAPETGAAPEQDYQQPAASREGAYAYEPLPTEPAYTYPRETPQPPQEAPAPPPPAPPAEDAWAPAPVPAGPPVTTVAHDATWQGTLRSSADIRIEGTLTGEIVAEQTLHVAREAKVDATVQAGAIVVAGHLTGQIECRERLEVLPTGHVSGQITAGAIVVREGAYLGGQLRMRGQDTTGDGDHLRPMLQRVR